MCYQGDIIGYDALSMPPTDEDIDAMIDELQYAINYLKNLKKLNSKGREAALIYMFGLTHFQKYRKR